MKFVATILCYSCITSIDSKYFKDVTKFVKPLKPFYILPYNLAGSAKYVYLKINPSF